ncbi:MAG: hypothetical protein KBT29_12245, partial [Prevotellaceae bacterium]|nr:hypothetical protein [Candidatus Minthosoma caballi]
KNPVDAVLAKARALFKRQLNQDAETIRLCINRFLGSQTSLIKEEFLDTYLDRICRLLDSKTFCHDCDELNLDAYNVATHFVFTGMSNVYKILDRGLTNAFPHVYEAVEKPVYERAYMEEFDTLHRLDFLIGARNSD